MPITLRTRPLALLAPALLVVGLAGCGGSDDAKGAATTAKGGATTTITIHDFTFDPVLAMAAVGDTITVTDADSTTHTLTADDGSFDTGKLSKISKAITLDTAGSFSYHCAIHTYMKGTIQVR
jgi:plastocyanin